MCLNIRHTLRFESIKRCLVLVFFWCPGIKVIGVQMNDLFITSKTKGEKSIFHSTQFAENFTTFNELNLNQFEASPHTHTVCSCEPPREKKTKTNRKKKFFFQVYLLLLEEQKKKMAHAVNQLEDTLKRLYVSH